MNLIQTHIKPFNHHLSEQGLKRISQVRPDEPVLNFSSSDYLSLSQDPRIQEAYQDGHRLYPTSSTGSMLVSGYHAIHKTLEHAFAEALEVDGCLLFSSGYMANLGVAQLLGRLKLEVLVDKQAHASIYDGLHLSQIKYKRYLHKNVLDLTSKIKSMPQGVIWTESAFSMSGYIAPLSDMALWSTRHPLMVDEAHAFGILGREGLGGVVAQGLSQKEVPLRMISLSKAYAGQGAVVAGNSDWIHALQQSARSYMYSSSISPAFAYGLLKTLKCVREAEPQREQLRALIRYVRASVHSSSLHWADSWSPIQQVILGCPYKSLLYAQKLKERGMFCVPMRQPTVSKRDTGLRVVLNAHHTLEHVHDLMKNLEEINAEYGHPR